MLLVDNDEAQFRELYFLFQQRVRTDHELRIALRDVTTDFALAVGFERARQQHDAVSGILQNPPGGKIMLLGKNFGGGHQRHLAAVLDRDDGGLEAHNSFARSYVALQQTTHGIRLLHVCRNLLQHPLLRRRGMKWENLLDRRPHSIVQPECDSGLRLLLPAIQLQPQFHEKQFVEDHPNVSGSAGRLQGVETFSRLRPVHVPERGAR